MSATKPTLATHPRVATAGRPPKVWLAWAVAFAALAAGLMAADVWAQTDPEPDPATQVRLFDIVSIADGSLLAQVLNGVAMLTGRDELFLSLVSFGLLCGLLLTVARALVTQRLELQYLLVGWMMFAAMFGPRVDVVVWDLESETFEAVDNVPIGVAAVGGVSSLVGVRLAQAFTTVFNVPAAAGATTPLGLGFADPLSMLVELRDPEYGGVNDGDADATIPNVDIQRTISRYMKDCVMYAVGMEGSPLSMSWESLRTAPNLLTAINVPAVTWHTVTYLPTTDPDGTTVPHGETKTCQQAYAELSTALTGFAAARFEFLGAKTNRPSAEAEVQAAMDYFFGLGRNAQDLMLNAVLARELEQASVDYQATAGNSARVTMLTQAVEQRRTQWAAEKTLFEEVAQPLMAYIEAFFYAVSPIMAFLFVLGPFGMKLFGRYLLLAAWIQLWIPIMALNNLYIHHGAARNIQALRDGGGADILSMVGLNSVWSEAASWIAVGGMMAAATPLLALMLLSGSYFAMTQLTNRMAGSDFTNEKIMSPDVMQPAAVASAGEMFVQSPLNQRHPVTGDTMYGFSSMAPQIEASWRHASTERSVESTRSGAMENWSTGVGTALSAKFNEDTGTFESDTLGTSTSASRTQVDEVLSSATNQVMDKHGLEHKLSTDELDSVSRGVTAQIAGQVGISTPGKGVSPVDASARGQLAGQIKSDLRNSTSLSDSEIDAIMKSATEQVSETEGFKTAMSNAVAMDQQRGVTSQFAQSIGLNETEEWKEARSGMHEASTEYSESDEFSQRMGWEVDLPIDAFGQQFLPVQDKLAVAAADIGVSGQAENMAGHYREMGWITDKEQALTAAYAMEMSKAGAVGNELLGGIVGDHLRTGSMDINEVTDRTRQVEKPDDWQEPRGPEKDPSAVRAGVVEGMAPAGDRSGFVAGGLGTVAGAHEAYVLDNEVAAVEEVARLEGAWHEKHADHIEEHWQPPTPMERLRDLDVANRILSNIGLPQAQGGADTVEAYQQGFEGAIERGASTGRAVLEGAWAAAGAAAETGMAPTEAGPYGSAAYETMIEAGVSENAAWVIADSSAAPSLSGTMRDAGLDEEWNERMEALQQEVGGNEAASGMVETMKSHLRDGQMEQFGQLARGLGSMYQSGRVSAVPAPASTVPE